jgi:hypothetical protein
LGRERRERTQAGDREEKMEIGKKVSTTTKAGEGTREISVEIREKIRGKCASFKGPKILAEELRVLVRGRRIKGNFQLLKRRKQGNFDSVWGL